MKSELEVKNRFTTRELEKFMSYGFFHCLDSFLFIFTFLPLRVSWWWEGWRTCIPRQVLLATCSLLIRAPLIHLGVITSVSCSLSMFPAEDIDCSTSCNAINV